MSIDGIVRAMEAHQASAALPPVMPMEGYSLAPVGLSEDDCLRVTDLVRSIAATWHTDLHENSFNQPSLIMAPCKNHRLQLALIAHRIDSSYFLDEISAGGLREIGEFRTIAELLKELRVRIRMARERQLPDLTNCRGAQAAAGRWRDFPGMRPKQPFSRSACATDRECHWRRSDNHIYTRYSIRHAGMEQCPDRRGLSRRIQFGRHKSMAAEPRRRRYPG